MKNKVIIVIGTFIVVCMTLSVVSAIIGNSTLTIIDKKIAPGVRIRRTFNLTTLKEGWIIYASDTNKVEIRFR